MSPLTLETYPDLPERCRRCVRWELGEQGTGGLAGDDAAFEKEAWLSTLLLRWPAAGRVAYVDGSPAGFVSVAPSALVSRSAGFPTSPVSGDAALLVVARVGQRYRGTGVARMLVQGVAKDLTRQGYRAIEVFAHRGGGAGGTGDVGTTGDPDGSDARDADRLPDREVDQEVRCLVPMAFAEAAGFTVVADHPRTPRLRLELRTALDWREDVEAALDHLLGSLALTSR